MVMDWSVLSDDWKTTYREEKASLFGRFFPDDSLDLLAQDLIFENENLIINRSPLLLTKNEEFHKKSWYIQSKGVFGSDYSVESMARFSNHD